MQEKWNAIVEKMKVYLIYGQHKGQALYNAILDIDPEFAKTIYKSEIDCFDNDENTDKVIKKYFEKANV